MALDLKAWLLEMGVPPAKVDDVFPVLASTPLGTKLEERETTFKTRESGLTQKETELATAQTKLTEANDRLNLEMVEWAETQRGGGEITEHMRTDLAKAQGEVARLTSVITTKATELGLDPKTILGELPVEKPKPDVSAPDLSGYVTREDLSRQFGATGRYLMTLPAELMQLQHEHQELTGEWLDPKALVAEVETRAGDKLNRNADGTFRKPIDVRAIWEERYNIPAKRSEKAKATHDAEIKAAEDRGWERARSEQSLPGQQPVGRHSPVFTRPGSTEPPKSPRPSQANVSDRISKAASSLATHRYRQAGVDGRNAGVAK